MHVALEGMLRSMNPATGELVGEVPITPVDAIPELVARARAAGRRRKRPHEHGRLSVIRYKPITCVYMHESLFLSSSRYRRVDRPPQVVSCDPRELEEVAGNPQERLTTWRGGLLCRGNEPRRELRLAVSTDLWDWRWETFQ